MLAASYVRFFQPRSNPDTHDLFPSDFLDEFDRQKQGWLKRKKKQDVIEALEQLPESLIPETAPRKRVVQNIDGIDTIVMKIDYSALIMRIDLMQRLVAMMMDDEEAILLLML